MAIGITKGLFYIYQISSYRKQNPFKRLIEKKIRLKRTIR